MTYEVQKAYDNVDMGVFNEVALQQFLYNKAYANCPDHPFTREWVMNGWHYVDTGASVYRYRQYEVPNDYEK